MNQPVITFAELLNRYQAGERSFAESDLDNDPDYDLSGQCLDGINLFSVLSRCIFQGCKSSRCLFLRSECQDL